MAFTGREGRRVSELGIGQFDRFWAVSPGGCLWYLVPAQEDEGRTMVPSVLTKGCRGRKKWLTTLGVGSVCVSPSSQ